jgi:hypothetical protein
VGRQDPERIDRADGRLEQAPQDIPVVGHSISPRQAALYGQHSTGQVE